MVWSSAASDLASVAADQAGRSIPGLVARLGKGFFSRGVCALQFTFDSQYLVAVSCDDRHSMGVFELPAGRLVCSAQGGAGVPPQVGVRSVDMGCMRHDPLQYFYVRESFPSSCVMYIC